MWRGIACMKYISTVCLLQSLAEISRSLSYGAIYCQPVFNCKPGYEVNYCTQNNSKDTCAPCREGEIQPQLVSSLDEIGAKCFSNNGEAECLADDLIPAREINNPICGIPCLCNAANCYYGDDPCRCRLLKDRGCGINKTMNKVTGECEPCPKHTFKNSNGCGPCYYIETEWHNAEGNGKVVFLPRHSGSNISDSLTTKNSSESPRTTQRPRQSSPLVQCSTNIPTNDNMQRSSEPNYLIPFAVVLCLAVVFATISFVLGFMLWRRRSNDRQNTDTRTRAVDQTHLLPSATPHNSVREENELDERNGAKGTPYKDTRDEYAS